MSGGTGSKGSLSKAAMRPGDFHLRRDDRQMFGNYVELSPLGGTEDLRNVRRSAMFVETPVYQEPRLWRLELLFSGPRQVPPSPLTPWVPQNMNVALQVTLRAALDRDKATETTKTILTSPNGAAAFPLILQHAFPKRYQAGHQIGVSVEALGSNPDVIGVQASLVEVSAARDAYGDAPFMAQFAQSSVSQLFLPANALRRQFFVQNMGDTPLYVAFDLAAAGPSGGPPRWTFALIGVGDAYESPVDGYQGPVSGVWDSDGGTLGAMVTEGT